MGLEILVPLLMGALLKVAGKAGEGVLKAVEEAAEVAATSVFARVRSWFAADKTAADDLRNFEAEPEVYTPVIQARLIRKLTAEPAMQDEFAALLGGANGPHVEVLQTIAEAHGITGAKIENFLAGRVSVEQRISGASDVTGVEIKRMGAPE